MYPSQNNGRSLVLPVAFNQLQPSQLPSVEYATNTAGLANAGAGQSSACSNIGGTCGDPNNCSGSIRRGLCPGGSDNVCCVPLRPVPTKPGSVYTGPPPGVNTAGFSPVLAVVLLLVGAGMVYEISQRK